MVDQSIYSVLEVIEEGIVVIDKDGYIIFINEKAAALDRIDKKSALNRHIFEVYPSLCEKTSTLMRVLKEREPIIRTVQTYKNYKGEELTMVNSSYPILSGKKVVGAMAISKDVTKEEKLSEEISDLRKRLHGNRVDKREEKAGAKYDFIDIIGRSEKILRIKAKANKAAQTSSPILIYGETGTGKELFVHAIHNNSLRKDKPFIVQNCAAIPTTLLEGTLFGTVRGSFTGAEDHKGIFEMADGGTLYLDELNSMPLDLQAKLLRVLQEDAIRRVGDTKLRRVDVRIIASVNEEPELIVEQGKIRKDLFYRLNVVRIDLPTLAERKEDIPLLVQGFIQKFNIRFNAQVTGIEEEALEEMIGWNWEGNIRELEHVIEAIFNAKQSGYISLEDLKEVIGSKKQKKMISLRQKLLEVEENYIKEAMIVANNNISQAAKLLDIPRQTLQYKLKKREG